MSQHWSFWPGFIDSGIILSNQSQGYPRTQRGCSHPYGTARRGEQRMRKQQSWREWRKFSGERDDDSSHSSCEAGRFSCIRPLVANTWFYFGFKLLLNRLQGYILAEPWHPGFSFQADAQNPEEVLFSHKHVLWLSLCPDICITWLHLWVEIMFAPETASASSDICSLFHMEGKSHPKSFQPTQEHIVNPSDSPPAYFYTPKGRK